MHPNLATPSPHVAEAGHTVTMHMHLKKKLSLVWLVGTTWTAAPGRK